MWERLSSIAQVIIAFTAIFAFVVAWVEYHHAVDFRRVNVSIEANKRWALTVTELTKPAIDFASHKENKKYFIQLKNAQEIILCADAPGEQCDHKSKSYGFLIDETGKISAKNVNKLRIAIVKYLNVWDHVAILFDSDLADKRTLCKAYTARLHKKEFFEKFEPFIEVYGTKKSENDSAQNNNENSGYKENISWYEFKSLNRKIADMRNKYKELSKPETSIDEICEAQAKMGQSSWVKRLWLTTAGSREN